MHKKRLRKKLGKRYKKEAIKAFVAELGACLIRMNCDLFQCDVVALKCLKHHQITLYIIREHERLKKITSMYHLDFYKRKHGAWMLENTISINVNPNIPKKLKDSVVLFAADRRAMVS